MRHARTEVIGPPLLLEVRKDRALAFMTEEVSDVVGGLALEQVVQIGEGKSDLNPAVVLDRLGERDPLRPSTPTS
jgi:hypothetical protein